MDGSEDLGNGEARPSVETPLPPRLADEGRWYTEHTALVISTVKWALLGVAAGVCVGLATRGFLWSLPASASAVDRLVGGRFPSYLLLPLALPLCAFLIRVFAPDARGHGTEAVIAAVHERSGKVAWRVAPVKLAATVLTLTFGGSVGKEGPAAQIGAALTSLFADLFRLSDEDRRRLVICGISAGFAAVFGTPVSGALFGIEVLYLGRLDYAVLFPCLVSGIVAHLVCGVAPPVPHLHESLVGFGRTEIVGLSIASGAAFGLFALLLIETMRVLQKGLRRFENHPYLLAVAGGSVLAALYATFGVRYAGLGTETIAAALEGTVHLSILAFVLKIVATSITLEAGGSGGIVTPLFFIGAASGSAMAHLVGLPEPVFASFGLVAVLAAAANTPVAAAVMGMELLPGDVGVYAALAAVTAFLMVGHRSVYASQKLGLSKSAGLEVELYGPIGDVDPGTIRARKGSLTDRIQNLRNSKRGDGRHE
jgi:H+/Cl- antiporter ClcA